MDVSSVKQQTAEEDKEVERGAMTTSVRKQECADHSLGLSAFIEPEKGRGDGFVRSLFLPGLPRCLATL